MGLASCRAPAGVGREAAGVAAGGWRGRRARRLAEPRVFPCGPPCWLPAAGCRLPAAGCSWWLLQLQLPPSIHPSIHPSSQPASHPPGWNTRNCSWGAAPTPSPRKLHGAGARGQGERLVRRQWVLRPTGLVAPRGPGHAACALLGGPAYPAAGPADLAPGCRRCALSLSFSAGRFWAAQQQGPRAGTHAKLVSFWTVMGKPAASMMLIGTVVAMGSCAAVTASREWGVCHSGSLARCHA
jgi:hypothetical protein